MHRVVLSLWLGLSLVGCAQVADLPQAPDAPPPVIKSYSSAPYRIQVGDVLDIKLVINPELNEEVTVRPDGHISTSIVTDAVAAGRTVPELSAELAKGYRRDLRNPRLSVIVKTFAPSRVFVGGEVLTPGEFMTPGNPPTLSQAIARAGGTKPLGDEARIFIIRRTPDDVPQLFATRYDAVRGAKDPAADIRLANYDVVYVPKTGIAEVYTWYNQHIQQFINPNLGFSYLLNPTAGGATVINSAK